MDKDRLVKRLMTTFLGELEEHVRALNHDLLALEKEPEGPGRAARFQALSRTVHSLKGAARSVSVGPLVEACHRLEEILTAAQDGRVLLDPGRFALLFE
ncbi:MAG TPA: Hpt domain-containing protein, partial [Isosphaeraceae bacterium]